MSEAYDIYAREKAEAGALGACVPYYLEIGMEERAVEYAEDAAHHGRIALALEDLQREAAK